MGRSALPWLLTLTYQGYWRSTHGDYIEDVPLIRIKQRLRETGLRRPALEPAWGLW